MIEMTKKKRNLMKCGTRPYNTRGRINSGGWRLSTRAGGNITEVKLEVCDNRLLKEKWSVLAAFRKCPWIIKREEQDFEGRGDRNPAWREGKMHRDIQAV